MNYNSFNGFNNPLNNNQNQFNNFANVMNNPNFKNVMSLLKNGANPESICKTLLQQRGINEQDFINFVKNNMPKF